MARALSIARTLFPAQPMPPTNMGMGRMWPGSPRVKDGFPPGQILPTHSRGLRRTQISLTCASWIKPGQAVTAASLRQSRPSLRRAVQMVSWPRPSRIFRIVCFSQGLTVGVVTARQDFRTIGAENLTQLFLSLDEEI